MSLTRPRYRLRELRQERGLSQGQLARASGHSKGSVSLWEKGHRAMTVESARDVANALGVPMEDLFTPAGAA